MFRGSRRRITTRTSSGRKGIAATLAVGNSALGRGLTRMHGRTLASKIGAKSCMPVCTREADYSGAVPTGNVHCIRVHLSADPTQLGLLSVLSGPFLGTRVFPALLQGQCRLRARTALVRFSSIRRSLNSISPFSFRKQRILKARSPLSECVAVN